MSSTPPHTAGPERSRPRPSAWAGTAETRAAPTLIGVGVDGTPSGRDAVALGSLIARTTGGELMLIGIHQEPLAQLVLPDGMTWATLEQETWAMLAQTRDLLAPGARIEVAPDALVWRGLRHVVRLQHRDLLVVGAAHDAHDGRVRLGANARRLLSHLECPLAVAPTGMQTRKNQRLARIGAAFDGGPESQAALALAASIAAAADAELELRVPGGTSPERIALEGNAVLAEHLVDIVQREVAAATGVRVEVDVTPGDRADALVGLRSHVDLLVIGSGQSGRRGRLQLGRAGHSALHDAPCAVLIVPKPAH